MAIRFKFIAEKPAIIKIMAGVAYIRKKRSFFWNPGLLAFVPI